MYEEFKQLLISKLEIDPEQIKPEAQLANDLGINSLELADLVLYCEDKYGIEQDKAVIAPLRFNENMSTGYTDDPAIVHFCGYHDWWDNHNIYRREYLDFYRGTN